MAGESPAPSSRALRVAPPLVLAVDDDAALRKLVTVWLRKAKLDTLEAKDGEEALAVTTANASRLDAIVLDVMMPGIDGFETLRRLKMDPETAGISVLLLTAHATDEHDIVQAMESGAVDHIAKPFSGPVLVAKVRAMCEQTRMGRELRRRLAVAEVSALSDPLTRLGNRRALDARLSEEAAWARRHGEPLSVAMLDIDHFKSFNDRYGHENGDRVLVHVAEILRAALRAEDAAFRFGGEELVVLFRRTPAADAALAAERVREALRAAPIVVGDPAESVFVTFSAGVAVADAGNAFAFADLVARADAALYRAKRAGRDRVVVDGAPE